jgi:branched-chain amino acid transport system permease protein
LPSAAEIKPRRRPRVSDLRWIVAAAGVLLLVQVSRTPDLRLHLVTGASLTQGALISAIALGVVLTYRGSGVVNFATGATAMYAAYVYTGLRTDGTLFLPPVPNPLALVEGAVHVFGGSSDFHLPSVPTEISFGAPLTFPTALGLSLVFCVLMGLALHFLVFRPLRTAPPLAKVVASVGVLLLLQAIIVRRFGTAARATLLGHGTPKQVKLPFSIRMNTEQLLVIGIVIALTLMLSAVFRFTRFGIATRAAAENEKGAMLLGFSPDFLAGNNWVLSTVISGLLGILVAGNQKSVDPVTITLLIVPALSVALVGGLTSFGITVAAAFALAMTQALIPYLGASRSWYPQAGGQALPGVAALLPFLLIVGVMFVNGQALPTRGSVSSGRLPKVANPTLFTTRVVAPLAVAGCALSLMFFATPNGRLAIITSLIGIVISLSFVVITGYVGQISLAQMMLAGISGFTLAKLTTAGVHLRGHTVIPTLPFPISPIVGALGAMVVGVLLAIPASRVRGVSLAIVTFAFAIAMEQFLFQNPGVNGGFAGAKIHTPGPIDPLKTATIGRGSGANVWFGMFCLGVVVVLCAMVVNLRRSATGRRFLATRSNERAAAAAGIDVTRTKLTAFALAAFIAGIAGALVGYRLGGVNQLYFGGTQSLTVFAFAYLGGIACISGAVTAGALIPGGIVFTVLQTVFKVPPEFALILGGLAVIATAIFNPEGVAGGLRMRLNRASRRKPSPAAAPAALQPSAGAP